MCSAYSGELDWDEEVEEEVFDESYRYRGFKMNYDFATLSTTHVSTTNKDLVDEDDNTNTNATSSTIDLDQAS